VINSTKIIFFFFFLLVIRGSFFYVAGRVGKTASETATAIIKISETTMVAIGPTLIPLDSSSKKRISPAPANGMGPSLPRRLDRLDFFFDIG